MCDVYLNGVYIGEVKDPKGFVSLMREERRKGKLPHLLNVYYDEKFDQVEIFTDKGRARRPLIVVKDGKPLLTKEMIKDLNEGKLTWSDLINKGVIEYLDASEEENAYIALYEDELTPEHTHLEITPLVIFGNQAALIPYAQHNMATRIIYGTKMVKQGVGVYASNYLIRGDTNVSVLHYPQKPLVKTIVYDLMNYDLHPFGMNVVIAILPWDGYNIEDAIVFNKSSVERGLFRSTYFKPYKCEELRYQGGIKDQICIPDKDVKGYRSEDDYMNLEEDGIVYPEAKVRPFSVLVGKVSPPRFLTGLEEFRVGMESRKETSVALKNDERGIVDSVLITENSEGNKMVKVIVRDERVPELGDKFASRYGQKGVIGLLVPQEDMPFTKDGIVPDIIFNPLGLPKRMTYGQVLECIAGKVAALEGIDIDATPFDPTNEEELRKRLIALGFRDNGTETLYDGRTGKMYKARIMIGNIYYMRLWHMVANKIQSRSRGPLQLLTRQPTEGRAKEGGLRLGEMEKDCLVAYGASLLLQERFSSDKTIVPVCRKCGLVAIYNKFKNRGICPVCGESDNITLVEMSYAFKLLLDELKSLVIYPQLEIVEKEW